jgi:Raf kinase inhibitor-like YbhB/YbcL family protein
MLPSVEASMKQPKTIGFAPLLLIALASCGASNRADSNSNGEGVVKNATLTQISLTSAAFTNGQPIPVEYTCDGANQAPSLVWGEPPQATQSFALVIDDPDAPSGTFRHWGVYDIPASARSIGGGQRAGTEVANDFGKLGYDGPCPPKGHGPHHYHFKLFALDVGSLGLNADAHAGDVEREAEKHVVGRAELIGTYERSIR